MVVYRNNRARLLNVVVGELDLDAEQTRTARRGNSPSEPPRTPTGFGMTLDPLTPEMVRRLDLPSIAGGAVVTDVRAQQPGGEAAAFSRDVILEVNRQKVQNVSRSRENFRRCRMGSRLSCSCGVTAPTCS